MKDCFAHTPQVRSGLVEEDRERGGNQFRPPPASPPSMQRRQSRVCANP